MMVQRHLITTTTQFQALGTHGMAVLPLVDCLALYHGAAYAWYRLGTLVALRLQSMLRVENHPQGGEQGLLTCQRG